MFIMANEPLKDISPSEFAAYFADKCTPSDLAEAYALSSNKFWWVEDNEYDFDVGTPEHTASVCSNKSEISAFVRKDKSMLYPYTSTNT